MAIETNGSSVEGCGGSLAALGLTGGSTGLLAVIVTQLQLYQTQEVYSRAQLDQIHGWSVVL